MHDLSILGLFGIRGLEYYYFITRGLWGVFWAHRFQGMFIISYLGLSDCQGIHVSDLGCFVS